MADLFPAFVACSGVAGAYVSLILYRGARSDIATRKFPAAYWSTARYIAPFTLAAYGIAAYSGAWNLVLNMLAFSIIAAVLFYILSMRAGFGGDCRALIYTCLLTPMFGMAALALIAVVGCIQVAHNRITWNPVPAPYAISILIGFLLSYTLQMGVWATSF